MQSAPQRGAPPAPKPPAVHPAKKRVSRKAITAWLFLAPSLLVLGGFTLYPMIQAAYLSLTDYNLIRAAKWVGLDNYAELFGDDAFWNAFGNTVLYAAVVTPATIVLALALALFLDRQFVGRAFVRTAIFLPFIVSLGIIAIAWAFLLDPNIGLVSYWLSQIGIVAEQGVLSDPRWAMPAVMFVGVWKNVGFYMVIYLAGLQSIPEELREAARLDGANAWQRFRNVTLPLLSNQTMLVSVMALIASLQAFDQIYVMTHGGPFFRTETLVMLIYREGFQELRFGYGAAISWVLLLFVLILSITQYGFFQRRQVKY
ncbi:sugar ABC transporter permease [Subtercola boreus]|uniref:Sugar ABC transporter permease n=1 Tax=Subtercola boreus TaxID=120213 RepID=A0A3E0VP67_9MICO|nr:sugar ABC transporter permease [Subtercola boreus]